MEIKQFCRKEDSFFWKPFQEFNNVLIIECLLIFKYTCLSAGRVVPECIVISVTWNYSLFQVVFFLPSVSFGLQHLWSGACWKNMCSWNKGQYQVYHKLNFWLICTDGGLWFMVVLMDSQEFQFTYTAHQITELTVSALFLAAVNEYGLPSRLFVTLNVNY